MRPPIDGGLILITGASAGIGRELARQVAGRARTLVLVARRADRLEALRAELLERYPGLTVHLAPCDLSDSAAIETMLAGVAQQVGDIDVLVNNAGFGDQSLYERADWPTIERMIKVNVIAVALLTRHLVGPMVERGRGGILNISSGAGLASLPGAAAYVGTKHFVTGFTETLRAELAGTGVVVSQVLPGPVDTEFHEVAGMESMVGGPPRFLQISAEQTAREAIKGFGQGRAMIFPGAGFRTLMTVQAIAPRRLQRLVVQPLARRLRRGSGSRAGPPDAGQEHKEGV